MIKLLFPLLLTLLSFPAFAKEPIRTIEGTVIKVSDGDTIQLRDSNGTKVKIRLYGIDAPETQKINKGTGHVSKPGQPFGEEAFQALKAKIQRKQVRLAVMDIDKYKRAVSVIWLGNRNVNVEMISDGFAWAYRKYLDRPHSSEYLQAEEQARREKRGLWQQSNPQPPWEFRQGLKMRK